MQEFLSSNTTVLTAKEFQSLERMRISQTWEVKGNDQVCTSDERIGTNCCRFQRYKKNRDEYVRHCQHGSNNYTGMFMVEDGIPDF